MSDVQNKSSIGRSIGAVFAGILANFLIAVPIDIFLHAINVFPPWDTTLPLTDSLAALAFSYRFIAALVGGYLTAKIAPQNPMKHAVILGAIGVLMSSAGGAAMWDKGPHWYAIALIVISIPCSWAGAKFYLSNKTKV